MASTSLPVDIPRMTGQNYIIVNLGTNGPSISGNPSFTSHTGLSAISNPVVHSDTANGFAISAKVVSSATDGDTVVFSIGRLTGYKAISNAYTSSMSMTLKSKGGKGDDTEWASGSNTFSIVLLLTGQGSPPVMDVYLVDEIVSNARIGLLSTKEWSPVVGDATKKYKTTDIFHTGTDKSNVYFQLSLSNSESDSLFGDCLFYGKPTTPESLVTVANKANTGDTIVPIVIKDRRKYTDQENCICVVPHLGISQATVKHDKVTLIDIECERSSSVNRLYANGDTLDMSIHAKSNSDDAYTYEQIEGTEPSYSCSCPNRDSNGNCRSQGGCTYTWGRGSDSASGIVASKWTIYKGNYAKAHANGVTWKDTYPPCSGWDGGAKVQCGPSFLYNDGNGSSLYEKKADMLVKWYEQGSPIDPSDSGSDTSSSDVIYECIENSDIYTYYQKREAYSKTFPGWSGPYGMSAGHTEASPEIITKNSSGVYTEGMTMEAIDPADDISDKIISDIGVGLMCVKPSWHHNDMAVVVGNDCCASTVGSDWAITAANKAGWNPAGAFLSEYSPLVRYMTPFASKQLKGTAQISISDMPRIDCNTQKVMSYYYKRAEKCEGGVILKDDDGNISAHNPMGNIDGSTLYEIDAEILVDYSTSLASALDSDMELNMYRSGGGPHEGVSSLFGCDTADFEGGIYYHIKKYSVKEQTKGDRLNYKYHDCVSNSCGSGSQEDPSESDNPGSDGCPSGCVRVNLTPGTTFEIKCLYYLYLSDEPDNLDPDAPEPDTWIRSEKLVAHVVVDKNGFLGIDTNKQNEVTLKYRNYYIDGNDIDYSSSVSETYNSFDIEIETTNCADQGTMSIEVNDGNCHLISFFTLFCCGTDDGGEFIGVNCANVEHEAYCLKRSETYQDTPPGKLDTPQPVSYTYSSVSNVKNRCNQSSSSEPEESSSSCVPVSCKDHCYYSIDEGTSIDSDASVELSSEEDGYQIGTFKSDGVVRTAVVYPFEGPNKSGGRYRSIMCAHSTTINGSTIRAVAGTLSESDSEYWEGDGTYEIQVEYEGRSGTGSATMIPSDYTSLCSDLSIQEATYVCKEPIAVGYNLDNEYSFNLSYEGSTSSSSSTPSSDFIAYGSAFLIVYYTRTINGNNRIEKGEPAVIGEHNITDNSVEVRALKYIIPSIDSSAVIVHRYKVSGELDSNSNLKGDPSIESSSATIDIANIMSEIVDKSSEYKAMEPKITGDTSTNCPKYSYSYSRVDVLCTYTTNTDVLTYEDDIKGWMSNGIPTDFVTQKSTDGSLPDKMQDILNASIPDSKKNNSQYTVTMYRK